MQRFSSGTPENGKRPGGDAPPGRRSEDQKIFENWSMFEAS
jgi:hypothetical protein